MAAASHPRWEASPYVPKAVQACESITQPQRCCTRVFQIEAVLQAVICKRIKFQANLLSRIPQPVRSP